LLCQVEIHFLNMAEWKGQALEFVICEDETIFIEDKFSIQDNIVKYISVLLFEWE